MRRWVVIQTQLTDNRDLVHSLFVVNTYTEVQTLKSDAENSYEFMSIDAHEFIATKDMHSLHVVFHYHDNYADVTMTFESYEEAHAFYKSEVSKMVDSVSELCEGETIRLAKFPGGGYMASLYDSEGNYPDKGDRWVITTVTLS